MDLLLSVKNLTTFFFIPKGILKAVDGISFSIKREESFGLVGESGCGKSTTALSIMRMLDDMARIEGEIILKNQDIIRLPRRNMRHLWGRTLFMIFQDPSASLNPVMKIKDQLAEVLSRKEGVPLGRKEISEKARALLEQVDLYDSERVLNQYPHQLSGGMKQRVMIAMGIALNPDLLILDEPTTALDSTVQFKMIELLLNVKAKYRLSQIVITHDFGVAAKLCDKIAVMYAGKIVEQGKYITLLRKPEHPYTRGLFKCIIKPDTNPTYLETMPGYLPSLYNLPQGCRFQPRCEISKSECLDTEPELIHLGDEHFVACHWFRG